MTPVQPTRVVLTGATGFLGGRVMHALVRDGVSVTAVLRANSDASRLQGAGTAVTVVRVGATDQRSLEAAFAAGPVKAIVHLATAYGRREGPLEIIDANLALPARLLEMAVAAGAAYFINADTFYTSRMVLSAGLAEYVRSKEEFRRHAMRVARSRAIRFVNVRIEHMYGPGDDQQKFIPRLLADLLSHRPEIALTEGGQRRDFVYVDDVAEAFAAIVSHGARLPAPIANIEVGSGSTLRLREMVELAHALCESRSELRFGAVPYREEELMESVADLTAIGQLGWSPQVSLRDGLANAIAMLRAIGAGNTA